MERNHSQVVLRAVSLFLHSDDTSFLTEKTKPNKRHTNKSQGAVEKYKNINKNVLTAEAHPQGGWGGPDPPVFEQRGSGGSRFTTVARQA